MGIVISDQAKDLIKQLLDKEATTRIGFNGDVEEILQHEWFAD